jgi:HSP20 family protein
MAKALTRWRPFGELDDLRSELERLFDDEGEGRTRRLALDVLEEPGKRIVRADVPGLKSDEVEITVEEGVLTVSGAHEEKVEEKEKRFTRRERRLGAFSRSMTLPEGVKPEEIPATCREGVLEVTIPVPEREPAKRIEITPDAE